MKMNDAEYVRLGKVKEELFMILHELTIIENNHGIINDDVNTKHSMKQLIEGIKNKINEVVKKRMLYERHEDQG